MYRFKKHNIIAFLLISVSVLFAQNNQIALNSQKIETEDQSPKKDISKHYKLIWQDNFDSKELDLKNTWQIDVNGKGGGNNELQYYRKENISLGKEPVTGENCLIITAKKQNYMFHPFTSGRLSTQDKISFRYGKIEARIKLPKTENGLWPAFWMLGKGYPKLYWPKCGEIDILEMGNAKGIKKGVQDYYFNGACHWGESWNGGSYPNYGKSSINAYPLQNDFHLFTMIWDETAIKMYLDLDKYPDTKPYYTLPINGEDKPGTAAHYFNKQFFIIFNLAVGGHFTGILDEKDITALNNGEAKMYIDFVRVYQKGVSNEEYSGIGPGSVSQTAKN